VYANDVYGPLSTTQPDPAAAAAGLTNPGGVEPSGRTEPRPAAGALGSPTLVLVALLGLAALLVSFSVHVEVSG
jgi:hypothetical protein